METNIYNATPEEHIKFSSQSKIISLLNYAPYLSSHSSFFHPPTQSQPKSAAPAEALPGVFSHFPFDAPSLVKGESGSPAGAVCAFSISVECALESLGEKTGAREGRICFTKTNSVAAGGANASAFGPTAASPSLVPVFSLRDSQQTGRI